VVLGRRWCSVDGGGGGGDGARSEVKTVLSRRRRRVERRGSVRHRSLDLRKNRTPASAGALDRPESTVEVRCGNNCSEQAVTLGVASFIRSHPHCIDRADWVAKADFDICIEQPITPQVSLSTVLVGVITP
jgi:hypothetical protein